MKKVIHVVEAFGGGIYSFLTELCNSLADDYEVMIVYSLRKETPKDFKKDFNPKIKFIKVDMCRGLNPCNNIKSFFQLKKVLKEEQPDIIHLHSSKAGFLGRIISYMNGFNMNKVFYNPHGFSFLQQSESKIKRNLFYLLEKLASKFGGCIVACSKGEHEEALKIYSKCININNAIDTNKIDKVLKKIDFNESRRYSNQGYSKITIGTIGRVCFQKNPDLFNEIAQRFPHCTFYWIGDGELRDKLTSPNIKVTGWKNREDVISETFGLDIYIMTSLWEGLPISLLEAMYLGKPVVVSNVIGNRDVIENGVNGYVCCDIDDFVKRIKDIINNEEKTSIIKMNSRNTIVEDFNLGLMLQSYRQLYLDRNGA